MFKLFLAVLVVASPLLGEQIGDIEFELPEKAKNWMRFPIPVPNNQGEAVGFAPKEQSASSIEVFAVFRSDKQLDLKDKKGIEKALSETNPEKKLIFNVLEEDSNSLIAKWIYSSDKEEMHGWGRFFSTPHGTVWLFYQTEKLDELGKAKDTWLPVLKQSKLLPPPPNPEPAIKHSPTEIPSTGSSSFEMPS